MSFQLNVRPTPADHPLRRIAKAVHGVSEDLLPPEQAWLSGWLLGILNQGDLGSCTGNGGENFGEVLWGSATGRRLSFRFSAEYLWSKTRQAEGSFPQDAGCLVSDVVLTWHTWGCCKSTTLPYDSENPDIPTTAASDTEAAQFKIGPPLEVARTPKAIKTVLSAGMPILIGMPVGPSFMNIGPDGKVPMPPPGETPGGGHCACILGYNPWGVMGVNTWGVDWGQQGFFYLPWGYEFLWWEAWTAPRVVATDVPIKAAA